MHNKCNALGIILKPPPPPPWSVEKVSARKSVPDAKMAGDCSCKGMHFMIHKLYLNKIAIKNTKRKTNDVRMIEKKSHGREGLEFQSHRLCGPEQTAESLCISDLPTIK